MAGCAGDDERHGPRQGVDNGLTVLPGGLVLNLDGHRTKIIEVVDHDGRKGRIVRRGDRNERRSMMLGATVVRAAITNVNRNLDIPTIGF